MSASKSVSGTDNAKGQHRKGPDRTEIRDLKLAGGVEGGMEAGTAGGPGQADIEASSVERAAR